MLPHTEADPAALYVQLLVALGNVIGPTPYFVADGQNHRGNLFTVIAGRTSKARKGTSWANAKKVPREVDPTWFKDRVKSGTVSGEGITEAFRGEEDNRLLLFEGEFAQVLQAMKREGNTVSVILRQAWDSQRLAVLRRRDPIDVHGAHVSLIGHITIPELMRLLTVVDMSNGCANRILWVYADRSKLLPDGGGIADLSSIIERIEKAVRSARKRGEVRRSEPARDRWREIYKDLSEPPPGQIGEILSRAEAQVMRIALLLALLDESPEIEVLHLNAALALWRYCEASARHIFAETLANPKSIKIRNALDNGPLTMTEIHALFHNNASKAEIDRALQELGPAIARKTERTDGRDVTIISQRG